MTGSSNRSLARSWLALTDEISTPNTELDELVHAAAPPLVAEHGVSRNVAAKLLRLLDHAGHVVEVA